MRPIDYAELERYGIDVRVFTLAEFDLTAYLSDLWESWTSRPAYYARYEGETLCVGEPVEKSNPDDATHIVQYYL